MTNARVNGRITANRVRVIDATGQELGVLALDEALNLARTRNEDLIEIEANQDPPLCQIIDYGKFRWRLQQPDKNRPRD